jgi:hypothetical protein
MRKNNHITKQDTYFWLLHKNALPSEICISKGEEGWEDNISMFNLENSVTIFVAKGLISRFWKIQSLNFSL